VSPPERPARARLFFALDLAPEARAALAAWRDAGLAGRDDLRAVPEEALHMTLAFLGETPGERIEAVRSCGLDAAAGLPAPVLAPGEVVPLPRRAPRLFALDLADEDAAASDVQAAVAGALAGAGLFEPEARPFWPHLTLARVRGGARGRPVRRGGEGAPAGGRGGTCPRAKRGVPPLELPPAPVARLTCRAVTLYRSHLSPRGARYEPLARRELT
jgi:2'-5' RNA ligase